MRNLRKLLVVALLLSALTISAPAGAGWMGTGAVATPTPTPLASAAMTEPVEESSPLPATDQSYDILDQVLDVASSILSSALTLL